MWIDAGEFISYFVIDPEFHILYASPAGQNKFATPNNFLNIVDEGSLSKVGSFIRPDRPIMQLEVNLMTKKNQIELNKLEVIWDSPGKATILCHTMQSETDELTRQLENIRKKLEAVPFPILQSLETAQWLSDSALSHPNWLWVQKKIGQLINPLKQSLLRLEDLLEEQNLQEEKQQTDDQLNEKLLHELSVAELLISQLQADYSLISGEQHKLDFVRLLQSILHEFDEVIAKENISVQLDAWLENSELWFNAHQLAQILRTLIYHSMQSVLGLGRDQLRYIHFDVRKHEKILQLTIYHNGWMVDEWVLEQMFHPTSLDQQPLAFLHLDLVRKWVEESGGKLKVTKREQNGTTLCLSLSLLKSSS
ncbi:HAMP domain-containing histidine kinase [Alicyclobacillus tolerans]|uniref:Histidine kinase domain-containing protein n=1 Tax=Alicyclobacillus tolerans TaxID=90970 RepID=A0A1M6TYT0_9BACL|nr:HAMP domain-containing histidine kinase [Alicyclobacillus montanus]SHK62106.1 hypothetical protein SAMN05443507_1189 [Alicyclobacillus montanus]